MKNAKLKIIGIILMLFVLAVTPSCEAFWQAMQDTNTQVDDNNTTDQSNTSKGKH
ncbi:MAG: hypothetical protein JXL97_03885 [Bacteroidales bacterium]|nr:hypothetical protein [Bacteroidales bacterium]